MDFAIQDKDGNLSLPNGSTVMNGTSGTSTPNGTTSKPSNSASASIPLPVRSDPSTTTKSSHTGTFGVKSGLAQMLKGGVIMDVMNVEQAKVAEEAGAVAVMALERIPSLIRSQGGIARMVSLESGAGGFYCCGGEGLMSGFILLRSFHRISFRSILFFLLLTSPYLVFFLLLST